VIGLERCPIRGCRFSRSPSQAPGRCCRDEEGVQLTLRGHPATPRRYEAAAWSEHGTNARQRPNHQVLEQATRCLQPLKPCREIAPLRCLPRHYAFGPERLCKPEATGSIPVRSTSISRAFFGRHLCHVLQVGRGRCVLRAPAGPVDLDRHPAGGGPRVDQFKCCVRAGGGE
jgi:hypothetical protein